MRCAGSTNRQLPQPAQDGDASEVAQSDIGDAVDIDDDVGWTTMEKGKRKATLERSGRMVAQKVKASIDKVSKSTEACSPFAKRRAAEAAKTANGGK